MGFLTYFGFSSFVFLPRGRLRHTITPTITAKMTIITIALVSTLRLLFPKTFRPELLKCLSIKSCFLGLYDSGLLGMSLLYSLIRIARTGLRRKVAAYLATGKSDESIS